MDLEKPAVEPVAHEQVLAAVRQVHRRGLGLVEPRGEVGDVVAERGQALAGDGLADEVSQQ
jgi:hypothetical protein